ncbi:sensor histidine kinase [Solitalea canadensis]|uniref:Putative regulator of cell autolysis n=1 Tax=Solitalea canadensis (strain ATCC 29591 / DSM 3403 / JCM 21819 / LMG 8368 / NBRC 15130 / NCIMB 12057 / USAM 9D) TaxID=929556 RepID=H8KP87_SOLCM|nr:histidine kinase [Solitalea canadensis]AFD05724.1 putative regulator of cell autolysis [Solitalea canadensis DSM 3403]
MNNEIILLHEIIINTVLKRIQNLFLPNNAWTFVVPVLLISLIQTSEKEPYTWNEHISCTAIMMALLLPVLLFVFYQEKIRKASSTRNYFLLWVACFVVYLSVLPLFLIPILSPLFPVELTQDNVGMLCLFCIGIELTLVLTEYFNTQLSGSHWLRKLNLEKSILLALLLLSVLLAAMGVSSMSDPRYHSANNLLIGPTLKPLVLLKKLPTFFSFALQFFLLYMAGFFFYFINNRFLIPVLLKQKGMIIYCLAAIGSILFFYPLIAQLIIWLPINNVFGEIIGSPPFKAENGWGAFAIMLVSLPIILTIQWFKQNNQITMLEKQKVENELHLLKQQINPHFFFNTLNNLYGLSLTRSEQTPEVILHLSDLMRYVIYEGQKEKVLLTDEINYIEDYLRLQQIRIHKQLDITFEKHSIDNQFELPPLLLIIFIENAFKHGIEPAENACYLKMNLSCANGKLSLSCENSVEPTTKKSQSGIGLLNLKRRLELLYPGKHELKMENGQNSFKIILELN